MHTGENIPKISIIIPVYNVADYLTECIESIAVQEYKDYEIILVDDGSTDGSEKLCDEYAARDSRVKVIHQRNQGVVSARKNGLKIPVVYNCGGYESVVSLRLLDGFVDVYLPDFKCISDELGRRYFGASDYSKVAKDAIKEMLRQTGRVSFEKDGCIKKGVIVRHLVLPGQRKEAEKILEYLYHEYGEDIYFSILNQYTPIGAMKLPDKQLQRHLTTYEYQKVIDYALSLGITKAYMQIGKTAKESFIPAFDLEGVRKKEKQQGMDAHESE